MFGFLLQIPTSVTSPTLYDHNDANQNVTNAIKIQRLTLF